VWKCGRHPICTAEIRRGKERKKERKKIETTAAKYNDAYAMQAIQATDE